MTDLHRRKQLIYRANHRGIKEMDIILGRFACDNVMEMSAERLDLLEAIMDESDRDLLTWFTGEVPCPDHLDETLFGEILNHTTRNARS